MKKPLLRLISITLSIVMFFSLSACKKTEKGNKEDTTQETTQPSTAARIGWYSASSNGVIFSVQTDKESYVFGETIEIYYEIQNTRDSDIFQTLSGDDVFRINATAKKENYTFRIDEAKGCSHQFPVIKSKDSFERATSITTMIYINGKEEKWGQWTEDMNGEYEVTATLVYSLVNPKPYSKKSKSLEEYRDFCKKVDNTLSVKLKINLEQKETVQN